MIYHLYIIGCILFTVFGQLLAKWRMGFYADKIPEELSDKIMFFMKTLIWDPYIIAVFASGFIASFFWLMAVSKFELSYAYPFMSLAFILVFILSALFFNEAFHLQKIIGTLLIVAGLYFVSRNA